MPRFNEQDYKRLNLFISNEMFAEFQELNVGKSIPCICIRLLKSHLLDLQLKAEFARINEKDH